MVLCDNYDCTFAWLHAKCCGIVGEAKLKKHENIDGMWFCPWCDEQPLWLKMGLEQPNEFVGAGNECMWKLTAKGRQRIDKNDVKEADREGWKLMAKGGKWVGQKDVKQTDLKAVTSKNGKGGKGKWAKANKAGKHMGMAIDA
jgi:hypothetical protein